MNPSVIAAFIIGFILGNFTGAIVMCVIYVNTHPVAPAPGAGDAPTYPTGPVVGGRDG